MRRLVMALIASALGLIGPLGAQPASASATQCGSVGKMCTEVIGQGTYVNRVRGRAATTTGSPCDSVVYHFEFWAAGWHHDTADTVVEGDCLHGRPDVTSEWVTVERDVPDGSVVCGRLWQKEGGRYQAPYREECVTIRR